MAYDFLDDIDKRSYTSSISSCRTSISHSPFQVSASTLSRLVERSNSAATEPSCDTSNLKSLSAFSCSQTSPSDSSKYSPFSRHPPNSLSVNPTCEDKTQIYISYTLDRWLQSHEDIGIPSRLKSKSSQTVLSSPNNTIASPCSTSQPKHTSADDIAISAQPSRLVDYLSHDWEEENLWLSWKHVVSKRGLYKEHLRLENACWRTWVKSKYKLKTVPPESLNWLKDCDVTWLYGPLQTGSNLSRPEHPLNRPSKAPISQSPMNKKSILKKRSLSNLALQTFSDFSLVRPITAEVQEKQCDASPGRIRDCTALGQAAFNSVTSPKTPQSMSGEATGYFSSWSTLALRTPNSNKHARFDEKVEQCIAVDVKEDDNDIGVEQGEEDIFDDSSDDSSDEWLEISKKLVKNRTLTRRSARSSFNAEKTIVKLPPTTLKDPFDSSLALGQPLYSYMMFCDSIELYPRPPQETLIRSNSLAQHCLTEGKAPILDKSTGASTDMPDAIMKRSSQDHGDIEKNDSGVTIASKGPRKGIIHSKLFNGLVKIVLKGNFFSLLWNIWRRK